MVDPIATRRIGYRALYVGIALTIIFVRLLPLTTLPPRWPGPDVLLCITVVWVLRRPDYCTALTIAAVFMADDLLSMQPPGLWAAIVVMGTEFLRRKETATRDLPFLAEWAMASTIIAAMILLYRLAYVIFMIPQGPLGQTLVQLVSTILIYPLLAVAMQSTIGFRRAATGEVDSFGHRL